VRYGGTIRSTSVPLEPSLPNSVGPASGANQGSLPLCPSKPVRRPNCSWHGAPAVARKLTLLIRGPICPYWLINLALSSDHARLPVRRVHRTEYGGSVLPPHHAASKVASKGFSPSHSATNSAGPEHPGPHWPLPSGPAVLVRTAYPAICPLSVTHSTPTPLIPPNST